MKFKARDLKETADISKGSKLTVRSLIKGGISGFLVLLIAYVLLGFVGELIAIHIPDKYEERFLGRLVDLKSLSLTPKTQSEAFLRAENILNDLTRAQPIRDLPYFLFLVDMKQANAMATPGGGIGVSGLLLDSVKSKAGLAMVLAHELGHHHYRHVLRRVGRALIFSLAFSVVLEDLGSMILQRALALGELGYSREQERDADEFGLRLVSKTYGSTTGALEFFENVAERKGILGSSKFTEFTSTHPITQERIENLRKIQKELQEK